MFIRSRRSAGPSRLFVASAICIATALLTSCAARPSDAPTVDGRPGESVERDDAAEQAKKNREITVGVDEFVEGFNPHLLADASPVTSLVARLTLPSAFVAAPVVNGSASAEPTWLINTDLLESVDIIDDGEVLGESTSAPTSSTSTASTSLPSAPAPGLAAESGRVSDTSVTNPASVASHVRYRIREGAQWSDGTPISGEDFRYLYQQITSTPGARDEAAYELIDAIGVSAGGRQVDVTFTRPMSHWQRLFADLLPAHLMRSNADGFSQSLATHLPASGGQYSVESMDVGRNIIRLVRNDRYWGKTPAVSEVITLRAVRSAVDGAEQLRSGQIQAVQVRPQETAELTYGLVPEVSEFLHQPGRELVLSLNLASTRLGSTDVRSEILGAINADQVAEVATGRRTEGSSSTAAAVLTANRKGLFTKGNPLRVGVIGSGTTARAAAYAVADQLSAARIPAVVVADTPMDLMRTSLPYGEVDAVVSWSKPASTVLAARERYACTAGGVGSLPPTSDPDSSSATNSSVASATSSESANSNEAGSSQASPAPLTQTDEPADTSESSYSTAARVAPQSAARSENLSGLCDREIDRLLDPDRATLPSQLAEAISSRSIELTLTTDQLLTVISSAITIPGRENPVTWQQDRILGRLGELSEVRRVAASSPTSEASESPAGAAPTDSRSGHRAGEQSSNEELGK